MLDATLRPLAPGPAAYGSPGLAIIVPAYKHSELMAEALDGATREAAESDGVVVIVNDGCPFPQTHEVALAWAQAWPESVHYVRTANNGLAAARNCGIRYAMARFPSLRTVYLLDADNRLAPGAMRRAHATMQETGADWVYPNIDMFGLEACYDYAAPYSPLRHLFQNICEAGSLVHRRVFETGIFFDEAMRDGFEDWDFWLQCLDAGFRGAPCAELGFQYRARRESMLRDSNRESERIRAYIRRKHARAFDWHNLLRLEQSEAPRYGFVDPASGAVSIGSVPGTASGRDAALADFAGDYWRAEAYPQHVAMPEIVVGAAHSVVAALAGTGLLDGLVWRIDDLLRDAHFVAVECVADADEAGIVRMDAPADAAGAPGFPRAHLVATRTSTLRACIADPSPQWIGTLASAAPEPRVAHLRVRAPLPAGTIDGDGDGVGVGVDDGNGTRCGLAGVMSFFHAAREHPLRPRDAQRWEWRQAGEVIGFADLRVRIAREMNAQAPLVRGAVEQQPVLAALLPVLSFGGVEQVALQVAARFRAAGWHTRAVITAADSVPRPARLAASFDSIAFLSDDEHRAWNRGGHVYFGHPLQAWSQTGRQERLVGLLADAAACVNFHAMHGNEVMGWLRRNGVVTATSLHVIDRDPFGAPAGPPYMMLPYEHAYDVVTAPSRGLMDLCGGLGVPAGKLMLLENAPTFAVTDAMRARRRARQDDRADRVLRVLFIGRLDRQKGFDRVLATIRAAKRAGLNVAWRVVGGAVLDQAGRSPAGELASLGITLRPPVFHRDAVIEHLLWSDAVLLPSRWEGSPLIIREAQALGAVPVATDVGAVREMIEHGATGWLVPDDADAAVAAGCVNALRQLAVDPAARRAMSDAAMAATSGLTWAATAKPFVQRITALAAERRYGR